MVDNAVEEGKQLRGNIAVLEARAINGEARNQIENTVREEVEREWKEKWVSSIEESENLKEMINNLQQVWYYV